MSARNEVRLYRSNPAHDRGTSAVRAHGRATAGRPVRVLVTGFGSRTTTAGHKAELRELLPDLLDGASEVELSHRDTDPEPLVWIARLIRSRVTPNLHLATHADDR